MRNTCGLLVLTMLFSGTVRAAERPNIIMIMADDVGYECFGCYGSEQYLTPNIDRLAAAGIRFNHAYSQPLCTPSRVKLMTGISNARNYSAFSILNRDQRTFGHYLRAAGYKTAVAGKWQLLGAEHYSEQFRGKGTWPQDAGFDRFCLWQVDRLGPRYWKPLLNVDGENRQFPESKYGPDVVTDYLLDFIEQNRDGPFLVYYPMILVHSPFRPTPDSADRQSKDKQRNFEDMVAYMDKLIGRIARKTEKLGIAGRTLLLFTGDNGTNRSIKSTLSGRVIQGGKGLTTDAGTRVPLVGYWPGVIEAGRVSDELIDFTDFLPTFLEIAGVKVPEELDGSSMLAHLKGEPRGPREWLYSYHNPRPERTKPARYVRNQRWKLYGDGRFYDIENDVLEQRPLAPAGDSKDAAAAREMLGTKLASMPDQGQRLLQFVED